MRSFFFSGERKVCKEERRGREREEGCVWGVEREVCVLQECVLCGRIEGREERRAQGKGGGEKEKKYTDTIVNFLLVPRVVSRPFFFRLDPSTDVVCVESFKTWQKTHLQTALQDPGMSLIFTGGKRRW